MGRKKLEHGIKKDEVIKFRTTSSWKLRFKIVASYEKLPQSKLLTKIVEEYYQNHGYEFDGCNIVNTPEIK